jgi:hypothetical protein
MQFECPRCGFVSIDGRKVRTTDGIVLEPFTDSKGQLHEVTIEEVQVVKGDTSP